MDDLVKRLRELAVDVEYCAGDYTSWNKSIGYLTCSLMREAADALSRREATVCVQGKWPERTIRAYRRKWRELAGVNPPHEGNTTHEHALAAALAAAQGEGKP